jgi:hypothetical protein
MKIKCAYHKCSEKFEERGTKKYCCDSHRIMACEKRKREGNVSEQLSIKDQNDVLAFCKKKGITVGDLLKGFGTVATKNFVPAVEKIKSSKEVKINYVTPQPTSNDYAKSRFNKKNGIK